MTEKLPPQARLRPATPEDADRLALVGRATFVESYAGVLPVSDILAHCEHQHAPGVYAKWLADKAWDSWLVEALPGEAPVGYAVMGPAAVPVPDPRPDDLELKRIYLLHRFQGAGWGRRLMEAALQRARERGSRRLLLGVYSQNHAALAFYARMGFTRAGERHFRVGASDYYDYLLGHAL